MLHLKICHHVRATKSVLRWTWDSHSGMLTRRVPLAGQELPTLPEHLSSPLVFCGIRAARSFVFCVMSCRSLFVLSSFFICPLCFLSVFHLPILIYPFGIFKLFLWCLVLQTNMASVALRVGRQIQRLHRHRVSRDTDNPLHYFRLDRDSTVT